VNVVVRGILLDHIQLIFVLKFLDLAVVQRKGAPILVLDLQLLLVLLNLLLAGLELTLQVLTPGIRSVAAVSYVGQRGALLKRGDGLFDLLE
jgi:hypothetical protein